MLNRFFRELNSGIEFSIYLTPGASRTSFTDIIQAEEGIKLKVSVSAKPVNNQANEALVIFISDIFKTAKSNILIKKGAKSRNKQIFISGLKIQNIPNDVQAALEKLINKVLD
ncbi:MAG: DUF167 domain-containing protein [Holosporales bacterium]|jgi:uncharacterized protein (TIGR00251 family)|nr:DUF167 domain-containing protein [Holosporales bacterium]